VLAPPPPKKKEEEECPGMIKEIRIHLVDVSSSNLVFKQQQIFGYK
jgi:hypothetical protein